MKKLFAILIALLCAAMVFAQEKPTVVVVPFDAKEIDQSEMEVLFEVFQSEFANTGVAKVVDRSSLDKIRKQQEFQASDWSNADKVAELGKALNASMVITGQLMMFKKQIVATVKLIDVNTTEIVSSVVERVNDTDELFGKLPEIAQDVAQKAYSAIGTNIVKKTSGNSNTPVKKPVPSNKKYKIGDEGPEGGIVFYVDEEGFDVYDGKGDKERCHYLEVSKEEVSVSSFCPTYNGTAYWYAPPNGVPSGTTVNDYIGFGKANTLFIINRIYYYTNKNKKRITISLDKTNCAAYACYYYKGEGIWYLPNTAELNLIYNNVRRHILATASKVNLISSNNERDSEGKMRYYNKNFIEKNGWKSGETLWSITSEAEKHSVFAVHAF